MEGPLPSLQAIPWIDPAAAFAALAEGDPPARRLVFLDSAGPPGPTARWSILADDPFEVITAGTRPFDRIEASLSQRAAAPGAIPFAAGGAIGYLGYGLRHALERLPRRLPPAPEPDLWLGLYDTLAVFDRLTRSAWIVSTGLPERSGPPARARARERAQRMNSRLPRPSREHDEARLRPLLSREDLAPRFHPSIVPAGYAQAVEHALAWIRAGDIYQANLAYRIDTPCPLSGPRLYLKLRAISPAPFGAYLDPGDFQVLSNSPERFLFLDQDRIETRPVKGTRPRGADPADDARQAEDLLASTKDFAEHVMIVDLERNDLGRVARPGSVRVERLAALETYANVHHLVSVVAASPRLGAGPVDCLRACFPGGSVTGAPKIRAMEIIEILETSPRGIYTGAIGGIDFSGRMDFAIAIRTAVVRDGVARFHTGGAIVADSKPETEYCETITKAEAFLRAIVPERQGCTAASRSLFAGSSSRDGSSYT